MAKYFDAEGNEVETMSPEEAQQLKSDIDNLAKEKADLEAEKARLEAGGKDKDENFASFRTKFEGTQKQLDEVTKKLADKEAYERTSTKNTIFALFAGEDKESLEKLEQEYNGFNIDDSTKEGIIERATKSAKVLGLYKEETTNNPVFAGIFGGRAPYIKPQGGDQQDNVVNTERGQTALEAMGVPADYGKDKK